MRRVALAALGATLMGATVLAQKATITLEPIERQMPAYIQERLSPADRVLFDKLMRVGL